MTDTNSFAHVYARHEALLGEANEKNKAALFEALAGTPVTRIHVSFDGEGDSGQIEDIIACAGDAIIEMPAGQLELQRASWGSDTLQPSVQSLRSAVKQLCYDFLCHRHGGWENNDGAFGEFEFDVASRTVNLEFNTRFTDHTLHEHTC